MDLGDVERVCRAMIDQGRGLLAWEWDSHFSAALSVTKDPQHHKVIEVIEGLFPSVWTHETIQQAPERIVDLCDSWGGLRPGQRLFTFDPSDDPLLFAAWWPWGGGKTFSLRIGCVTSFDEDLVKQLRTYFVT
jgi:hypothetical protein